MFKGINPVSNFFSQYKLVKKIIYCHSQKTNKKSITLADILTRNNISGIRLTAVYK